MAVHKKFSVCKKQSLFVMGILMVLLMVPQTVIKAEAHLVERQGVLRYCINDDDVTVRIVGCDEQAEEVVVPSEIEGLPVVEISSSTFSGCNVLKSVVLPKGIKSIGYYAFRECSALESIRLSDELESIGASAFEGCINLKEIVIPSSVITIGWNAFNGCSSLEEIIIPSSVKTIYYGTFFNCPNLRKVMVLGELENAEDNRNSSIFPYFNENPNIEFWVNADSSQLTDYILRTPFSYRIFKVNDDGDQATITHWNEKGKCDVVVPSDIGGLKVVEIGSFAFDGTEIENVVLPDSVVSIGDNAFENCMILNKITLPSNLTSIGNDAFHGCSSLQEIEIPDSVNTIGENAFAGCILLNRVVLPAGITCIEKSSFSACYALEAIDIPSGVTQIKESAFSSCKGLKKLVLPDGLEEIGERAFYSCGKLDYISLPATLKNIGYAAFEYCNGLSGVVIPASVEKIDEAAFYVGLLAVDNFVLYVNKNSYAQQYAVDQKINYLAYSTGENGVIIEKYGRTCGGVNIPASITEKPVTEIATHAVSMKGVATTISLPASLTVIPRDAFENCDLCGFVVEENTEAYKFVMQNGLDYVLTCGEYEYKINGDKNTVTIVAWNGHDKDVIIPKEINGKDVTCIGEDAFANSTCLESVEIPTAVTEINNYAFSDCDNLKKVVIPSSVTEIGKGVFEGCDDSIALQVQPGSYAEEYVNERLKDEMKSDNEDDEDDNTTTSEDSTSSSETTTQEEKTTEQSEATTQEEKPATKPEATTQEEKPATKPEASTQEEKPATKPEATTQEEKPTTKPENTTPSKPNNNVTTQDKPSNPGMTTTQEKVRVAKVKSLKLKNNKKKKITVSFKKIKGAKYEIQYSTDKKFKKKVKTVTASVNKKTISKVKKGSRYYVRVRAYKKVNGEKKYGDWCKAKRVNIKK